MPTLEDCRLVREELKTELGSNFNPCTAHQWWVKNRERKCPPERSKFYRVVESLLEQTKFKMLGTKVAEDSFWGYLHTCDLNPDSFEFHHDSRIKGGVSLIVRLQTDVSEEEKALRQEVQTITKGHLAKKRKAAYNICPSAINVGAMICGPDVGQPGAKPDVITKLLSAASWWGPGDEGSWHVHDHTWNCTDKKDFIQRTIEAQGRILWRVAGSVDGPVSEATKSTGTRRIVGHRGSSKANGLRVVAVFLILLTL